MSDKLGDQVVRQWGYQVGLSRGWRCGGIFKGDSSGGGGGSKGGLATAFFFLGFRGIVNSNNKNKR